MGAIVVGGEALVDLVLGADEDLRAHAGGGPFNTARTLGRLEQPVHYLGRISRDRFGARMRAQLLEDGVALDAVVDTDDPTTLALAEVDAGGSARYRFYTEGTSAPGLTPAQALDALPAEVEMLHVGTLGLVLEPVATALEAAVEHVAGSALVMVDPNVRPVLMPDREAYLRRLDAILARAHAIKVSEEDLEWLDPEREFVDAARALLSRGPSVALVTCGADGALAVTATDVAHVPAPPVEVVDTIGAGDAFSGGFLAAWRRNGLGLDDLGDFAAVTEATRFASAVASLTCARPGASPPRLADLAH